MKEVEEWIKRAEKDLNDAEFNFGGDRLEVAAFLSHQAAEKALKALYIQKFKRLWKIHDLKELGERVGASTDILEICDGLNPFYIETRYPLEISYKGTERRGTVSEGLKNAKKVIEWVKREVG